MIVNFDRDRRKKLYYISALIISILGYSIFHIYDVVYYPEITLKIIIRSVFILYCLVLLVVIKFIPDRYISIFDFLIFIPCTLMLTLQCLISDGFANGNYAGFIIVIFIASLLIEIKPLRFSLLLLISVSAHFIILSFHPVFSERGFYLHLMYIFLSSVIAIFLNYLVTQMRAREEHILREKEILLKEIHHRVKNNLQVISSLLNLQAGTISDNSIKAVVLESQARVKSMALIHQLLYETEQFSSIDFSIYLNQLMTSLHGTFKNSNQKIQYFIHSEPILLDIDKAIPLGLITNELVTNAYKYAFENLEEGIIEIELKSTGNGNYMLKISDNGKGLPDSFNPEHSSTLGLKLVHLLTTQIDGTLDIINTNGASYIISFQNTPKN
jgi:two-component sensor histidine kinase